MIQIDLATLVKRLNPFAKQALEMAASECMSQQASEITVAHVLLQMLAIPRNDVRVIAERTGISAEDLRQALTVESYPGGRSAEGYPSFSPMLIEWLKESWLLASAQMQHSELRSGVLLLTLLHSPLRYIPPAAARLLTYHKPRPVTAGFRSMDKRIRRIRGSGWRANAPRNGNRRHPACPLRQKHDRRRP